MNNLNANPTQQVFIRRAQSRFIQIDENCIQHMSLYAMAIYQQLRLLADFTKDCDEIKATVESLAKRGKMSERRAYEALNELEHEHYVIQRINYNHYRYGQINSYLVARDYHFFNEQKPAVIVQNFINNSESNKMLLSDNKSSIPPKESYPQPSAPNADQAPSGFSNETVQNFYTPAPNAASTAPNAYLDHNYDHRKTSTSTSEAPDKTPTIPVSSFIFSEFLDAKILALKLDRDPRSDSEFLEVARQHVDFNSDQKYPRNQRVNALAKLLSKLKEQGELFNFNEVKSNPYQSTSKQQKPSPVRKACPFTPEEIEIIQNYAHAKKYDKGDEKMIELHFPAPTLRFKAKCLYEQSQALRSEQPLPQNTDTQPRTVNSDNHQRLQTLIKQISVGTRSKPQVNQHANA